MKKTFSFLSLCLVLIWVISCAPTATVTSVGGPSIAEAQAERYDGPKARLAVGDFTDKTATGGGQTGWAAAYGVTFANIGDGMRDMLTTALFNSNRFIVLEREQLGTVMAEQDLALSNRIKKGTEAPIGEIYGADLIITAAITEFQGTAKGAGGSTRIAGIRIGGGVSKGHIGLDIRIIDAKTSQIVAATSVEGDARSFSVGGSTYLGGRVPLSLGGISNTPIEKAIRVCINKAVEYIATRTPAEYYRHK